MAVPATSRKTTQRIRDSMPIYAYRCPTCQTDFEVSRRLADRAAPALCPADGTEGKRLMTAPNVGGLAVDPAMLSKATGPAKSWNHFGHSHTGDGSHSHDTPPAAPTTPTST